VLERVLPQSGRVLEIASGTGQHVVHFARALPNLRWQPSDPDAHARRSISAWIASERLANIDPPCELDVRNLPWGVGSVDAVVCINMVHIAPWAAATSLLSGAGLALRASGVLYLYGPYRVTGEPLAPSNEAFDESLRAQNREWGLRELDRIREVAEAHELELVETAPMPANNLSVVFRRRDEAGRRST
jgi:SAM-dependent methyltransferase